MRELEKRRQPIRILFLRLLLMVLLLVTVLLIRGVWNIYQKERETYTNRSQAEQELRELEEREMTLRTEIAHLRSPQGVEESLREQFDVAKAGEGVIVLVDNNPTPEAEEGMDLRYLSTWKRLIPLAPWRLFAQ